MSSQVSPAKGIFALFAILFIQQVSGQYKLEKLNIDPAKVGVSGISSGGAMATQFHFSHSKDLMGAGIFAGGPFMCAYGVTVVPEAASCLQAPGLVNVDKLIRRADNKASNGDIDPTYYLMGSKVYIFHGTKDSVVRQGSGKNVKKMYEHYGADVHAEFSIEAQHCQPTDNYGGRCGVLSLTSNFINNCNYNGAYEMLNYLHGGNLIRPNASYVATGELHVFDQTEFVFGPPNLVGLAMDGLIYIPTACKNGERCSLQIAYHGCASNREFVGDEFATKTQHREVADLNNIVLLFPQTQNTLVDPMGCWDWFGYSNLVTFPTKDGPQIKATYKMMQRLVNGS